MPVFRFFFIAVFVVGVMARAPFYAYAESETVFMTITILPAEEPAAVSISEPGPGDSGQPPALPVAPHAPTPEEGKKFLKKVLPEKVIEKETVTRPLPVDVPVLVAPEALLPEPIFPELEKFRAEPPVAEREPAVEPKQLALEPRAVPEPSAPAEAQAEPIARMIADVLGGADVEGAAEVVSGEATRSVAGAEPAIEPSAPAPEEPSAPAPSGPPPSQSAAQSIVSNIISLVRGTSAPEPPAPPSVVLQRAVQKLTQAEPLAPPKRETARPAIAAIAAALLPERQAAAVSKAIDTAADEVIHTAVLVLLPRVSLPAYSAIPASRLSAAARSQARAEPVRTAVTASVGTMVSMTTPGISIISALFSFFR